MRIAIPVDGGQLSSHFGRCEEFVFVDVEEATKSILSESREPAPPHQPGLLPAWIADRGASVILTGGMGPRAIGLLEQRGIRVVLGVPRGDPVSLAKAYVEGTLEAGDSTCDHPDEGHGHGHGHGFGGHGR